MAKKKSHLSGLAAYAEMMSNGETARQVGAVCFQMGPSGGLEVLLVTTRDSGRWTIPKGWLIKGLKPHEAAEREAWEEAGVRGKAQKKPIGRYTYLKVLDDGSRLPATVDVHLLEVTKAMMDFPECKERQLEWLSPIEAALRVSEPELKSLLAILQDRSAGFLTNIRPAAR